MSKKNSSATGTKWAIAKVIIACICFGLSVYQVFAGLKMIEENNKVSDITPAQYDDLKMNDIIQGEINGIDTYFVLEEEDGESNVLYCVKSDSGHILAFRAPPDTEIDSQFYAVVRGDADSVLFKGRVRGMTDTYRIGIINYLDHKIYSKQLTLDMPVREALLNYMIDASTYDSGYSDKAIIATFIGAALMFIIGCLFLVTIIKNAVITILSEKGKYDPKLRVTKDDIVFEMQGMYSGNEKNGENFFVNTEYNIRDYGVNKNDSPADRSQLPSLKDDPALNRGENDEPVFYSGSVNDEGNFYVDSKRQSNSTFDKDGMTKKY